MSPVEYAGEDLRSRPESTPSLVCRAAAEPGRERRASIRNLATKFVGPCKDPHPRGSALVTRRAINTAFVPPNANELVITASIPTADRASLGT